MLAISAHTRLFLYHQPISMRKSFEGLSAAVEQCFPGELYSGALFIFLNRQKDHIKVLFWDGDGLAIYFKRLEQGTYSWKWGEPANLDRKTFLMLLEGVVPKRIQNRFFLGN